MKDISENFKSKPDFCMALADECCKVYNIDGKGMVVFSIRLPIFIPFRDGRITTRLVDKKSAVALVFYSDVYKDSRLIEAKLINSNEEMAYKKYTVVEIIYTSKEKNLTSEKKLNRIFDKAIDKLNELIIATITLTKNTSLYRINTRILDPVSLCRYMNLQKKEDGFEDIIFLLNYNVNYNEEVLDDRIFGKIVHYTNNVVSKDLNPFITSEELMLSAIRQKNIGNLKEAVMLAQTSVESFFRSLHKHLLVREGKTIEEIEKKLRMPFITMMKTEFGDRIGGVWSTEGNNIVGNWFKDTYQLRNKIVHSGLVPTVRDVDIAVERANDIRMYAVEKIKLKLGEYKDIAELLI